MEEFKEVLSTKRYASAYWQNRLGQFYLKHKDYDNAIKFFEYGIETYPESSTPTHLHLRLGNAYEHSGNKKQAKKAFKHVSELEK